MSDTDIHKIQTVSGLTLWYAKTQGKVGPEPETFRILSFARKKRKLMWKSTWILSALDWDTRSRRSNIGNTMLRHRAKSGVCAAYRRSYKTYAGDNFRVFLQWRPISPNIRRELDPSRQLAAGLMRHGGPTFFGVLVLANGVASHLCGPQKKRRHIQWDMFKELILLITSITSSSTAHRQPHET